MSEDDRWMVNGPRKAWKPTTSEERDIEKILAEVLYDEMIKEIDREITEERNRAVKKQQQTHHQKTLKIG